MRRSRAQHRFRSIGSAVLAAAALLVVPASAAAQTSDPHGQHAGWRTELTGELLEPWTRHARDTLHGGFRTHLDRRWRPAGPPEKYPSMLGRHLFSYSAGYLATGDRRWLALADSTYRYLVRHGWDERHGGWFDRLTRSGEPAEVSKSTFVQVYAATGLTLYHFVTRRPDVRERIRRTNRLLETRFRDGEHGGYFQQLSREFSVVDSSKTAASQLAPVSGHLLYHYAATRDTSLLRQARRLMRNVTARMRDPETGWIRERFTPGWRPAPTSAPERYNVGHNVEVAWLLARLDLATGADGYGKRALELGGRVSGAGLLGPRDDAGSRGGAAWIQTVTRAEARPSVAPPDSGRVLWWIQAYGNMTELTLHRIRGDAGEGPSPAAGESEGGGPLARYRRGAAFWRRHLLDGRFGAAVTAVDPGGELLDGGKGGRWKTSYHAVEHALWNWLGEALWTAPGRSVTLHFRPESGSGPAPRRICPRLVPDGRVAIRAVRRGDRALEVAAEAACFRVPAGGPPLRVTLGPRPRGSP